MSRQRIDVLDSFRSLAILSVLFYHYTFRWAAVLPGSKLYGNFAEYGWLGVQFFFVISGFVICYTLENTDSPGRFFVNRLIRLFPPLVLCTIITFSVAALFDHPAIFPEAHRAANFLPSLTLISPNLLNYVSNHNFFWINGSYWSLWVEIQFYVLAAAMYYADKTTFMRNILWTAIGFSAILYVPATFLHASWGSKSHPGLTTWFTHFKDVLDLFNLTRYINWFALGAFFHYLYKGNRLFSNRVIDISFLGMLGFYLTDHYLYKTMPMLWIPQLIIFILFGLLLYRQQWLRFLDLPVLRRIGVISYTVYLIHEDLGVLLINKLGPYVGYSPFLQPAAMILAVLFAELSWRTYEKWMHRWLKKKLPLASSGKRPKTDPITAVVPASTLTDTAK